MLLKDSKVKRPSKTKIQRRNGVAYVYAVTSTSYNSEKKYASDHRVCIGKMIDDTYMIPNSKFNSFYPEEEIELKEVDRDFSDTVAVGNSLVINNAFNKTHIAEILYDIFEDRSSLIKDLIAYIIFEESCVFEHFEFYERKNITSTASVYSDSTVSKLLKDEISFKDIQTFLEAWNKQNASKIKDVFLNVDATNIGVRSEYDGLAEYGYAKDNPELKQVNISYVSSNKDSSPLSYELYNGSIHDSNEVYSLIKLFDKYGYSNIGLIFDRAYYSLKLLKELKDKGYSYIFMLKDNFDFVKDEIEKNYLTLTNQSECYIEEHGLSCVSKEISIKENKKSLKTNLYIYYNDLAHTNLKAALLNEVSQLEKDLLKLRSETKAITKDQLKKYEKYFIFKYDTLGYLINYKKNIKKINEEIKYFGFFALLSSKNYSGLELLNIYRHRDSVEKLFRALKSSFDFDHVAVHYKSSLESKVFITFIASIIRNYIFQKTLSLPSKERKRYTIPYLLNKLNTIEATLNTDDYYFRKYALTKEQKKLLSLFKLKEKDIDNYILTFNNSLK